MYKLDSLAKQTSERNKTHNHLEMIWEMFCFRYEMKLFYMMCLLTSILTGVETQISEKYWNMKIF